MNTKSFDWRLTDSENKNVPESKRSEETIPEKENVGVIQHNDENDGEGESNMPIDEESMRSKSDRGNISPTLQRMLAKSRSQKQIDMIRREMSTHNSAEEVRNAVNLSLSESVAKVSTGVKTRSSSLFADYSVR